MKKSKWVYMPHPGHFICADRCKFFLNTYVGKYIVSTVGEFLMNETDKKFETIGVDRLYETMVFKAKKSKHQCCPYTVSDYGNLDFLGYNTAGDARRGHMRLCNKWSKKRG